MRITWSKTCSAREICLSCTLRSDAAGAAPAGFGLTAPAWTTPTGGGTDRPEEKSVAFCGTMKSGVITAVATGFLTSVRGLCPLFQVCVILY